jgi:16S rRNA processing protein RimM
MDEPTVVVGRITRAHGVTGELAVLVISEVPGRFADGATLWLEDGRTLTVASSRPHKDRLLVRFRGVEDRAQAEALQRALLIVPESWSPELPDGSWWDHRIVGCVLETDTGHALGTVRDVIHTAANDVWSAIDDDGVETLVPVLKDVIVDVDLDAKRIVVHEIPGLTASE